MTEQTPNGLATYIEPTFRTYEPEWLTESNGVTVIMQLCEELVEGRWEAFYSIISDR
jgi:hypothetical protein